MMTSPDLVVVSVPMRAYLDMPVEPLSGKVVMDTNNYSAQRDGHISVLDDGSTTSSELLQAHLPTSYVVKAFNNIYFKHLGSLARPSGATDRTALPIAGDDGNAKATVAAFLDTIGYDAVDAGPLGDGGRRYEPGTPAYGPPYGDFNDEKGTPADAASVRRALGL
jgi:8-hydroxy-5-deazaflavin:NADPH oxidoreductase